jgi:hypothetical protein
MVKLQVEPLPGLSPQDIPEARPSPSLQRLSSASQSVPRRALPGTGALQRGGSGARVVLPYSPLAHRLAGAGMGRPARMRWEKSGASAAAWERALM